MGSSLRRRLLAAALVAVEIAAAVAAPALHQARHRDDHRHVDGGVVWERAAATPADHHEAFDADFAALGLSDAVHFGVAQVDCALAAYTLADCSAPSAAAHSFGDELLARLAHRHSPRPFDPTHGAGSLAHFRPSLLAPAPVLPPPPPRPIRLPPAPVLVERAGVAPPLAVRARGPPRVSRT